MKRAHRGAALLAAGVALALDTRDGAAVDVTGTWNFCLSPNAHATATLTQTGSQVTGSIDFFAPGTPIACTVGAAIDPGTGVVVPGIATSSCSGGANPSVMLGSATNARLSGVWAASELPLYGLRSCDPLQPSTCDDGNPATIDACLAGIPCPTGTETIPPSCAHIDCASAADCDDGNPCTADVCGGLGCEHVVQGPSGPPRQCEDGDACSLDDLCTLAACETGLAASPIAGPRLSLRRLQAPSGDDRLRFVGEVVPPTSQTLDPVTNGIRVVLLDVAGATVADVSIPGGAFDPATRVGWQATTKRASYSDRRRDNAGPFSSVLVLDRSSSQAPGLRRVKVKGKRGSYPVSGASLPLGIAVDLDPRAAVNAAGCAVFPTSSTAPGCSIAPTGTTVKCK